MLTLALRDITVQCGAGKAARGELVGHFLGISLSAHEDQHRLIRLNLEHAGHSVNLVGAGGDPIALTHRGRGGSARLNADFNWVN